jgi:hypothetical protein
MAPHYNLPRSLAALRIRLDARAVGAWRVSGRWLEQLAFEPAPDMPPEIAEGFASATRRVDLVRVELAIARAASSGEVVVSIAEELPADIGSGYWLRAFGAARSVAVPIVKPGGAVALIVSVALGLGPEAGEVESAILAETAPGSREGRSPPP